MSTTGKGESAQEQFDKMIKTPVHQLVFDIGTSHYDQYAGDKCV